jgi:hypothetical protein
VPTYVLSLPRPPHHRHRRELIRSIPARRRIWIHSHAVDRPPSVSALPPHFTLCRLFCRNLSGLRSERSERPKVIFFTLLNSVSGQDRAASRICTLSAIRTMNNTRYRNVSCTLIFQPRVFFRDI